MSQVRKYKTGSLIVDGKKYDATPEMIQALSNHLSGYGEAAAPLAGLTNALANGEDVVYDSVGNTITGMSGKWAGIDEKANEKRNTGTSQWRKRLQAITNADPHQFRRATTILSGFRYNPTATNQTDNANLKDIFGNNAWFEYVKDENGNTKWSENSGLNASLLQRINDVTDYLRDPEAGKKKYKLASEYSTQHMQNLQSLYDSKKDEWDNKLQEIIGRAQSNDLGEDDIKFLNNFFIVKPDASEEELETAQLASGKKRFADSGLDYDKWSPYISWNDEGNYWGVTDEGQQAFRDAFGGNGNYWFNDAFVKSRYNPNGAYDFLNGYFVLGDRLYNQNDAKIGDSDLSKILNRVGGFRELNAGMRHNDANKLIEQLWEQELGWNAPDGQYYSNWLDPNGNIYYRSRTGDYDWTGKNNEQQLLEYVEANPELADEFGYYTPKFRLTDAYGNVDLNDTTPVAVSGLVKLDPARRYASDFNRHRLYFSDNGNSEFDGRYILGDGVDDSGKTTGATFWVSPNNDSQWIFESDELSRYVPGLEGNAIKLPRKMTDIFMQNPQFLRAFQENSEFRRKFTQTIAGAVGRGGNLSTVMAGVRPALWESLGFTPEQARDLTSIIRKYGGNWKVFKSSRGKRRVERMVSKPTLHKEGGKVEKAAMGDMLGSAGSVSAAPSQIKTDKPIRDAGTFTNFGKDKLQDHDWLELGAVLADAASIGFAFTPASVVSGITGMAGSTAGFAADVRRDGFQGSDLGQYGLNLLLDSVSFLPVIGGATKSVKVANNLKKIAPIVNKVMKAAALYGISNTGVQSWEAIKSGNFNMRDLRAVVNALGGAAHIARSGIKRPTVVKGETSYPTINLKSGKEGSAIKLTESQFNTIAKANPKTKEELATEIGKLFNKTKDQILDTYDIDEFFKTRKRFRLFGKEQEALKGFDKTKGSRKLDSKYLTKDNEKIARYDLYKKNLEGDATVNNTIIPTKTITEYVPQGTPQQNVMIAGENGVYAPSNNVPVVLNKQTRTVPGKAFTSTHSLPRITPVTSGVIWERTPDELHSPAEVTPIRQTVNRNRYTWTASNQPLFRKQGGKIQKGQNGLIAKPKELKLKPFGLPETNKSNLTVNFGTGVTWNDPNYGTITSPGKMTISTETKTTSIPGVKPWNPKPIDFGTPLNEISQGEFRATPKIPDFITVPSNTLGMIRSINDINKQLKNSLNTYKYYQNTYVSNTPRFIDSGEGNAYRNAANKERIAKNFDSDPIRNAMLQRSREADALNLELQGALADSQNFGKYMQAKEQYDLEKAKNYSDVLNQRDYAHSIYSETEANLKNAAIANRRQILDAYRYAMTEHGTGLLNKENQKRAYEDYQFNTHVMSDRYNNEIQALSDKYNGDLSSDAAKAELRAIQDKYRNLYQTEANKVQFAKSGTRISDTTKVFYSRDPYPELLIENLKQSTKIVEKLNDNIIKLLLQIKPTHAS